MNSSVGYAAGPEGPGGILTVVASLVVVVIASLLRSRRREGCYRNRAMLVCLDVDYRPRDVVAACVGFEGWASPDVSFELAARVGEAPAAYVPGRFYLRELPHLLRILELARRERHVRPALVLIDGYVSLGPDRPGLGEHLHRALGGRTPIVGVAKTPFRGATHATEVKRGTSERPLYVTAIGLAQSEAAAGVAAMHGPHRIPTMLWRVDRACREWRGRPRGVRVL